MHNSRAAIAAFERSAAPPTGYAVYRHLANNEPRLRPARAYGMANPGGAAVNNAWVADWAVFNRSAYWPIGKAAAFASGSPRRLWRVEKPQITAIFIE